LGYDDLKKREIIRPQLAMTASLFLGNDSIFIMQECTNEALSDVL